MVSLQWVVLPPQRSAAKQTQGMAARDVRPAASLGDGGGQDLAAVDGLDQDRRG
jgi:hypothetical protein